MVIIHEVHQHASLQDQKQDWDNDNYFRIPNLHSIIRFRLGHYTSAKFFNYRPKEGIVLSNFPLKGLMEVMG